MSTNSLLNLFQQMLAMTSSINALPLRCAQSMDGEGDGQAGSRGPFLLGRYFARLAQLETASAESLTALHEELAARGAPRRLLLSVSRAARDEIGHARLCSMLARHHGEGPLAVAPLTVRARCLRDIAIDNAIEGGVRQRYGALLVATGERHGGDALVRTAMKAIATDEVRHADLLFSVSAWASDQLDPITRQQVLAARRAVSDKPADIAGKGASLPEAIAC